MEGHNGIDLEPVEIFKGIKGAKGRNFYPADLGVEEFHEILTRMVNEGKIDEVKKILSVRTMVRRDGKNLFFAFNLFPFISIERIICVESWVRFSVYFKVFLVMLGYTEPLLLKIKFTKFLTGYRKIDIVEI